MSCSCLAACLGKKQAHPSMPGGLPLIGTGLERQLTKQRAVADASTREECTVERARSNTPQQALVLLNDPSFIEAARGLAMRVWSQDHSSDEARIDALMQHVLQRDARAEEQHILLEFLATRRTQFAAEPESAAAFLTIGDHAAPQGFDSIELAAAASTARAVLNLHESITRY